MHTEMTNMLYYCRDCCFFLSSDIYQSKNLFNNFGELLENIFMPLYEVSIDPGSHPELYKFLNQVIIVYSVNLCCRYYE